MDSPPSNHRLALFGHCTKFCDLTVTAWKYQGVKNFGPGFRPLVLGKEQVIILFSAVNLLHLCFCAYSVVSTILCETKICSLHSFHEEI